MGDVERKKWVIQLEDESAHPQGSDIIEKCPSERAVPKSDAEVVKELDEDDFRTYRPNRLKYKCGEPDSNAKWDFIRRFYKHHVFVANVHCEKWKQDVLYWLDAVHLAYVSDGPVPPDIYGVLERANALAFKSWQFKGETLKWNYPYGLYFIVTREREKLLSFNVWSASFCDNVVGGSSGDSPLSEELKYSKLLQAAMDPYVSLELRAKSKEVLFLEHDLTMFWPGAVRTSRVYTEDDKVFSDPEPLGGPVTEHEVFDGVALKLIAWNSEDDNTAFGVLVGPIESCLIDATAYFIDRSVGCVAIAMHRHSVSGSRNVFVNFTSV